MDLLTFALNMTKSIGRNVNKNLSGRYSQKLLDHAKQTAADAFKITSKSSIQNTANPIGDLIGNAIANRITKISINLKQNNSETAANQNGKEIP